MAGAYIKPITNDKHFFIDFGAGSASAWAEVTRGVQSRGVSISESTQEYYDMYGRGVAEEEVTAVKVARTFTGFKVIGDKAQDEILTERLFDLDKRRVKVIETYAGVIDGGASNAICGDATLTVSDDGSGDANVRENFSFGYTLVGKPDKGVCVITNGIPTFTKK